MYTRLPLHAAHWLGGLLLFWLALAPVWAQAPAGCQPAYLDNFTTQSGLTGEYYSGNLLQSGGTADARIAKFSVLPSLRRNDAQLNFTTAASFGTAVPGGNGTLFSARYRGSIYLAAAGTYYFQLNADDAAYLWVGPSALAAVPVAANAIVKQDNYSASTISTGFVVSAPGLYDLQLLFSAGNGNNSIVLSYGTAAAGPFTVVPATALCAGPAGANAAPTANAGNSQLIGSASSADITLSPTLSGTDADGSIGVYQLLSLPTGGTLKATVNGVANTVLVAGQGLTAAEASTLSFAPNGSTSSPVSFRFLVIDNQGRTGGATSYLTPPSAASFPGAATYTINLTSGASPTAGADAFPVAAITGGAAVAYDVTTNDASNPAALGINKATIDLIPGTPALDLTLTTAAGTFTTDPAQGVAAGQVRFTPSSSFAGTATATYSVRDNNGLTSNQAVISVTVNVSCQPSYLDNTTSLSGVTSEYYATDILENGALTIDNRIALFNRMPRIRRNDAQVNFPANTSWGSIAPPATVNNAADGPDQYSARFRGSIFLAAGDYTFQMTVDDAAYLWLGPTALTPTPLVANAILSRPSYATGPVRGNFTAATSGLYDLQLLYSEGGGGNNLVFSYASGLNQTTGFSVVPNYVLCAGPASSNAAPVAVAGSNATSFTSSATAAPLAPGPSGTDTSPGTIAYYTIISLPAGGTLALGATPVTLGQAIPAASIGSLTYDPSGPFTGTDSFVFGVIDDQGRSSGAAAYDATGTATGATYSIQVTNSAPVVANITNARITNISSAVALNPGVSATDLDGSVFSYTVTVPTGFSGTLRYQGNAVAPGAPLSIPAANISQLTYQPASGFSGSTSFTFTATDNLGQVSSSATYTIPVVLAADVTTTLRVVSTPGAATTIAQAPQGSLVFYEGRAINNGPGTATGVMLTIQLPINLTGVSLSNSGSYDPTTGIASFPVFDLGSGGSVANNIAFTMLGTTVNGTATANSTTTTDGTGVTTAAVLDPNPGNNTSAVASVAPTQVADVVVAINGPTRVLTNASVLYTVEPTNLGPSTATGVALKAQLPTNLTGVTVSNSGFYNATSGVVTWGVIPSIPNGGSVNYTVRFNGPATAGTILAPAATYSAKASATTTTAAGDPVAANNDGSNGAAQITTQVITDAATLLCIGNSTLNVTLSSGNFNTFYPGVGAATTGPGNGALTVDPTLARGALATPLASGDLVLIMQVQGSDLSVNNDDSYGDNIGGDGVGSGNLLNANFTAGTYEYGLVNTYNAATGALTLTKPLAFNYLSADATATSTQRRYQVVRVPLYNNVDLSTDISTLRWDGRTGGVMAMDVNGTLNLNGHKIDMAGRGFRGAAGQAYTGSAGVNDTDFRHSVTLTTSANKGEGTSGTPRYLYDDDYFQSYRAGVRDNNSPVLDTRSTTNPVRPALLPASLTDGYPSGDRARGAPGNAGGGGVDGNPINNDENSGGGGGSNAGRGGVGGNAWKSNEFRGGFGGADFTQATASRFIMGGGGGGGTNNNATVAAVADYPANQGVPANGFASSGAAGGGIVIIRASKVGAGAAGTGTIDVSGATATFVAQNDGSGGGGGGGSVLLLCNASNGNSNSPVLQNITILAKGGNGGSNTGGIAGAASPHGPGGGGSGGVAFTSSATKPIGAGGSDLTAGTNGTTYGFAQYGSGVGSASLGQVQSGIGRGDVPNIVSACPADVTTTVIPNTASKIPGDPITFTVKSVVEGNGTALNVVQTLQMTPGLPITSVLLNGAAPTSVSGDVATYAAGTYDQSTGLVTFNSAANVAAGASNALIRTVTVIMPNQNLVGFVASTSSDDLDPVLTNNDGSEPDANFLIQAINKLAGTIFDDVNYGGGAGRNRSTANASAVAAGFTTGALGSGSTRVELYDNTGTLFGATTSGADGVYGFASVPLGDYSVRVLGNTVRSVRNPAAAGVSAVQTFRRTNVSGILSDDVSRVGGENPLLTDGVANTGSKPVLLSIAGLSDINRTAFIDQVEIVDVVSGNIVPAAVLNNGFETPAVVAGAASYSPAGATWTFQAQSGTNGSGIARASTAFHEPTAPQGSQVAFLQGTSAISQTITLPYGTYQVRLRVANSTSGTNDQQLAFSIDGVQVGFTVPGNLTGYDVYQSLNFTVASPLTLSTTASATTIVAQSRADVTVGAVSVVTVDFGFNFDLIVNTNASGAGSLSQFITNTNALPNGLLNQDANSNATTNPAAGIEQSIFMISDGNAHPGLLSAASGGPVSQLLGGVAIIRPTAALPALSGGSTVIDGTSQTGNIGDTNTLLLGAGGTGTGATKVGTAAGTLSQVNGPEVQLQGTPGQAGSDLGLSLENTNQAVTGLSIFGFGNTAGNLSGANLRVTGAAISGISITGNVIGASATSFTDPGASLRSPGNGILLTGFSAGATITASVSNNLIGFHGASGIESQANSTPANLTTNVPASASFSNNEVRGNALLAPAADGVHLGVAGGQVLNSLIVDNNGSGIDLDGTNGAAFISANTIQNNGAGGTETAGLRAYGQSNTVSLNIVSGNAGDGILVRPGSNAANVAGSTTLSQNRVFSNGQLGINLLKTGDNELTGVPANPTDSRVTLNDLGDVDGRSDNSSAVGGNALVNFPVLQSAVIQGTTLVLRGFARPGTRIELFGVTQTSPTVVADGSGFGEGPVYLGQVTENAAAAGTGELAFDGITGNNAGTTGTYSGTINGQNQGTDNTNRFSFTIPLASLPGIGTGSVLSATGTLAGIGTSEFSGNVSVTVPLTITGTLFEDLNYGGGAGRSLAAANAVLANSAKVLGQAARVELYDEFGGYLGFVNSNGSGTSGVYTFPTTFNISPGNYKVRVVSSQVRSTRAGNTAAQVPVLTYVNGDGSRVGGENPLLTEAGFGATTASLSSLTTGTATALALAPVTVTAANLTGIDFGFNFSTIVNTNAAGQGSLRQFIINSNALAKTGLAQDGLSANTETSIFMIPDGSAHPGLLAAASGGPASQLTSGVAVITLSSAAGALPSISSANTILDGNRQNVAIGNTNAAGPEVQLNFNNLAGLTLASTSGQVTSLSLTGASGAGLTLATTATGSTISQNVISANTGDGIVALNGSSANRFTQNSLFGNGQLGIDLSATAAANGDGVTLNATGKTAASGANGLLNFPMMTLAKLSNGTFTLTGFAPAGAVVEVFVAAPNASGFGEGKTYLTSFTEGTGQDTDATTGSYSNTQGAETNANKFAFSLAFTAAQAALFVPGTMLTATATVSGVTTSEFSGLITVVGTNGYPLPVELTEFVAQAVGNTDAVLSWTTASEQRNDHFEIERSFDGQRFAKIGQVAGQGSKATPTHYTLTDAKVAAKASGSIYYRLQQVDTDGHSTYSPVRVVVFSPAATAAAVSISLYPVPAKISTTLDLTALPAARSYAVHLTDLSGRLVGQYTLAGGEKHALDLTSLASGSYLVQVAGADNQGQALHFTKRLTKE